MVRKGQYNYGDFDQTGRSETSSGSRVSNRGGTGGNDVFNRLGNNQNSFQALADAPAPGRIAFGGRGTQSQGGGNHATQSSAGHRGSADKQQGRKHSRMSVKDQITEGLSNMNSSWKLSCFSMAESVPEGQTFEPHQKNEVLGDVSFEEVRWADYQQPDKQLCVQRFAEANRLKLTQFQALAQRPRPPSQGGPPLPEPPSPYLNPSQPGPAANPTPGSFGAPAAPFGARPGPTSFGVTTQAAPGSASAVQQGFGVPNQTPAQPPPSQSGRIKFGQKAGQAPANPFASAFQGQATSFQQNSAPGNPFGQGGGQPGRLQFGARAGQPAAPQAGSSRSNQGAAAPFGSQSKPVKPFNSTEDPFGRQKPGPSHPGQVQQPAAQMPAANPFAQHQQQQQSAMSGFNSNPFAQQQQQQQQPPATPAPFGAFGGPQAVQSQPSPGLEFQTPAVQQRPAFGGGVVASLQTPSPGVTGAAAQAVPGNAAAITSDVVRDGQPAPDLSAWTAAEFIIGKIPEDPPPFELCR